MVEVREIAKGQTAQAGEAMLVLGPRWESAGAVVDFVDVNLRPRVAARAVRYIKRRTANRFHPIRTGSAVGPQQNRDHWFRQP